MPGRSSSNSARSESTSASRLSKRTAMLSTCAAAGIPAGLAPSAMAAEVSGAVAGVRTLRQGALVLDQAILHRVFFSFRGLGAIARTEHLRHRVRDLACDRGVGAAHHAAARQDNDEQSHDAQPRQRAAATTHGGAGRGQTRDQPCLVSPRRVALFTHPTRTVQHSDAGQPQAIPPHAFAALPPDHAIEPVPAKPGKSSITPCSRMSARTARIRHLPGMLARTQPA